MTEIKVLSHAYISVQNDKSLFFFFLSSFFSRKITRILNILHYVIFHLILVVIFHI